jgi:hypothetical protein
MSLSEGGRVIFLLRALALIAVPEEPVNLHILSAELGLL